MRTFYDELHGKFTFYFSPILATLEKETNASISSNSSGGGGGGGGGGNSELSNVVAKSEMDYARKYYLPPPSSLFFFLLSLPLVSASSLGWKSSSRTRNVIQ